MHAPVPPRTPPAWLRALGRDDLPRRIRLGGVAYEHTTTFKHDFFAATGLYAAADRRAVVKIYRAAPFLGVPMRWSGRLQARHEIRLYRVLAGIPGIPALLGPAGPTGFAHEFVAGHPLTRGERPPDGFFAALRRLIADVHRRQVAYVDLEKRENILVGDDGRPWLIDFQISFHLPANRLGDTATARGLLRLLQAADRYHLLKHIRRHRPDQLTAEERRRAEHPPWWIAGHRLVFRPITAARRAALVRLGARRPGDGRSEESRQPASPGLP